MKAKLVTRLILGQAASILFVAVVLFWAAGRIDWWPAWAAMAAWLAWFAAEDLILLRDPGLLAERLAPPGGARAWDKVLLSAIRLLELARYIVAGLDQRNGWTGGFPAAAQIAGLAVCALGTALFTWALASNAFFSQVVRIQANRGHAVATGGPYRYVRHPGYLAAILFDLALSVLLASWGAVLISGLRALLFILRTTLEDRTLRAEMAGYEEYTRQVRYRLIPGLW